MQVKSYLATVILICLMGGYLIETVLSDQFDRSKRVGEQYNQSILWEKDFDRMVDDISLFLVTVDLILGSDATYLIYGAMDKADYIIESVDMLIAQQSPLPMGDDLVKTSQDVQIIMNYVNDAGVASGVNREDVLNQLLSKSDVVSSLLVTRLYQLRKDIAQAVKGYQATVSLENTNAMRAKYMSRGIFSIIVLILWYWANCQISRPLRQLANMAKAAEAGEKFVGITSGPLEIMELSENTKRLTNSLSYEATHDALTDLFNRREFERLLGRYFTGQESISEDLSYVLAYIDLDHFKVVNDTCGHAAGDELLSKVALLLQQGVRSADHVARLGGDEFAILLNGCDLSTGLEICNKVRQSIIDLEYHYGDDIYRISASIGITEFSLKNPKTSLDDIVNAADTACKVAKDSGRDRVHVFDVSDETLAKKRHEMLLVNQINSAIDDNRFALHRQYILPLQYQGKESAHYEILIRMVSPDGKLVFPGDFLPIVERYHLGARLDRWVVNSVIDWLVSHPIEVENLETCAINLSGQSVGSKELHEFIVAKLKETNFPASKLCFEITETAAITDLDKARQFIAELKAAGCRFALDDFGSGLSSYAYLQKLDVDIIKIDGAFVKNMLDEPVNFATVKSINELARAVNMKTIAEFVENAQVAQMLKDLGVDYAQGYYFSKPELLGDKKANQKAALG